MMRVTLTDEYWKNRKYAMKANKGRRGTVKRIYVKKGIIAVIWDGTVTPENYHKSFIKWL